MSLPLPCLLPRLLQVPYWLSFRFQVIMHTGIHSCCQEPLPEFFCILFLHPLLQEALLLLRSQLLRLLRLLQQLSCLPVCRLFLPLSGNLLLHILPLTLFQGFPEALFPTDLFLRILRHSRLRLLLLLSFRIRT